jgi:anti-anti-sigma regulatory factor
MYCQIKKEGHNLVMIKLENNRITIYEVNEVHSLFLDKLNSGEKSLSIDFSDINKIDMAGLQLLVSLKKSSIENAISLKFDNLSKDLEELIGFCDLDKILLK